MNDARIGIDGYNLALPNGTGVATYGYTLATLLLERGYGVEGVFGVDAGRDPTVRDVRFFEVLGRPDNEPTLEQRRRKKRKLRWTALVPFLAAKAVEIPLTGRIEQAPLLERIPTFTRIVNKARLFDLAHRHFAYYGRMLPLTMIDPPPIMHWTYPVPIRLVGARNLYTLHDLVPLQLPYTTLDSKSGYRRLVAMIAASADHLSTVSETSKAAIVAEFGTDPQRITTTWQSAIIPPDFVARDVSEDAAIVRNIFGLPFRSYFLFFGAIEPKKNVRRLLESYLALGTNTPLVIVGGRGWHNESELALLQHAPEDSKGKRRVIKLEHLSRPLLLRLIRTARAALFHSLSEGFGLPILEAMQLGTPVLTSAISAMSEVAGDAAIKIDPYDTSNIAQGLAMLDGDPELREKLGALGTARSRICTNGRYADRIETMYARMLE